MKQCINWHRVISNGGLAFCTTLLATGFQTEFAVANALLIAGVALFTELRFESDGMEKIQRVISTGLVA